MMNHHHQNISSFAFEIMIKIFEHLTFHERLMISIICKSWHELAYSPQFCKKLFLHLRTSDSLAKKPYAREMFARCRNVIISCALIEDDHLNLLKEYMEGISLELLKISTLNHTAKRIVESTLQKIAVLKTLRLDLKEDHENETIRISHPTLKCAILNGQWDQGNKCDNLTILESYLLDNEGARGMSSLQRQLTSLTVTGSYKEIYTYMSDSEYISQWDHLRELYLIFPPYGDTLEDMLERMPCLEKLSLHNKYDQDFTGQELKAAKCLSELALKMYSVDTNSLNKYLSRSSLRSLSLLKCMLASGTEVPLKSASIKRMNFERFLPLDMLPLFPNLEDLSLLCSEAHYSSTINQICQCYPKLERLSIGVRCGQIGQFQSAAGEINTNPFLRINSLSKLKVLRINRIDLRKIDWMTCKGSKVEFIWLNGCSISGTGADQLLQSFEHLRTLYLDHCYLQLPQSDLFDIDETCVNGLRSRFPNRRISYYDCHIEESFDRCGRVMDVI
ncbi:uncharacterized protein LOC134223606 isoform X2 [Armigeres subalbatus]|uniref:uncharacterized protein LOC134223606 isoform X2 n=1 Tax=Armigeres subalbatus TaxID=124917 RepID=UPI002ED2032A